jgi:hypothetical protein
MPNQTTAPKKRFNIKDYSLKIQRKYSRISKAKPPANNDFSLDTTIRHYRQCLVQKQPMRSLFGSSGARAYRRALLLHDPYTPTAVSKVEILKAALARAYKSGGVTTPPTEHTDWVGVELEFIFDVKKLTKFADSMQDFLCASKVRYYSVTHDGSLRVSENRKNEALSTLEIPILDRATTDMKNITTLCTALNKVSSRVNAKCGLHVHIDCRHLTPVQVEALADRYLRALPLLEAMQHPIRRNSHFTKSARNFGDLAGTKYYAINVLPYYHTTSKKTIEIRIHSGSTNAKKIIAWCKLLQCIKDTEFEGEIRTTEDAFNKLPTLDPESMQNIIDRVALYAGNLQQVGLRSLDMPQLDEEDEETKLAGLVNYKLLQALHEVATQQNPSTAELQSAVDSLSEHEIPIMRELGANRSLVYFEILSAEIRRKARERNITVESTSAKILRIVVEQINNAHSAEETDTISYSNLWAQMDSSHQSVARFFVRQRRKALTTNPEGTIDFSKYLTQYQEAQAVPIAGAVAGN